MSICRIIEFHLNLPSLVLCTTQAKPKGNDPAPAAAPLVPVSVPPTPTAAPAAVKDSDESAQIPETKPADADMTAPEEKEKVPKENKLARVAEASEPDQEDPADTIEMEVNVLNALTGTSTIFIHIMAVHFDCREIG